MVITDYRVQSVLRAYTRELQRAKLSPNSGSDSTDNANEEKVSISGEGKRKFMMERMTNQVLEKMYPKQDETDPDLAREGKE